MNECFGFTEAIDDREDVQKYVDSKKKFCVDHHQPEGIILEKALEFIFKIKDKFLKLETMFINHKNSPALMVTLSEDYQKGYYKVVYTQIDDKGSMCRDNVLTLAEQISAGNQVVEKSISEMVDKNFYLLLPIRLKYSLAI